MKKTTQLATFGGGCFWCTEAIFKEIRGVLKITSGYAGGSKPNPTYAEVSSRSTGHAEVVQIEFEPQTVSYEQLFEIFFLTHDPTQLNRQGNDVGEQYRSVIFYHDDQQKDIAQSVKNQLEKENVFGRPIVTTIEPFKEFYPAESYHQDYYAKNPEQAYCQMIISPKVAKFRKKFAELMKKSG